VTKDRSILFCTESEDYRIVGSNKKGKRTICRAASNRVLMFDKRRLDVVREAKSLPFQGRVGLRTSEQREIEDSWVG